ncbi:MAG: hypothetical protein EA395_12270 [Phormidium sp. GEM2.Bin31]|nr:MAG: hypothetical protein EA395_12270 [Phormidium sp. GEM2.Bin31]
MEPLPLPSHIHYELLLQLLERQALFSVNHYSEERRQIDELIMTLRKALSQQKRLEQACQMKGIPVEYRWSLNQPMESHPTVRDREAS